MSLAFVRGIHRWPVKSPHKGPVTRKCLHLMTSSFHLAFINAPKLKQRHRWASTRFHWLTAWFELGLTIGTNNHRMPYHRSNTSKFVTPTALSCVDKTIVGVPLSPQRTRQAPTRHFRFRMSTNEYWKNSDNWIICCHKFPSDVSSKVSFLMWLRNVLIICK